MSLDELKIKIKEDIQISRIIGHYLSIKKSGSSLVSLCPFHSDSKPSMHINDSKKMFKCFSCEAAGDSIGFVMKLRNLDFVDALKEICQKEGLSFESYQEEKKYNPKLEMAKKILTKTTQLYRKTAESHRFFDYDDFIKKRGLNEEVAKIYNLGFAPPKNSLYEYLITIPDEKEKQFALLIALELGLIKKNKNANESYYDTFRERIIFPIWDQTGQVIGFTSRAIRNEQKAKYLNSIDSFIFSKGSILYGLHLAKNAIREKDMAILVEGNMDQIALYNYGFHNTVAIMGIALSTASLDRLLSLTKNIYLALDSDQAGFSAMERINRQIGEKGIVAKFIEFSPEKDPDEFLEKEGPVAFQAKLDNAISAFDVILEKIIPDKIPEVLDRKLEILNKAFEIVSPLRSQLSASERILTMAKRLGFKADSSQIFKIYEEFLSKLESKFVHKTNSKDFSFKGHKTESQYPIEENLGQEETNTQKVYETAQKFERKPEIRLDKMEKLVLQELVQLPSLFTEEKITEILDLVLSDEVKKYIGKIKSLLLEIDENEYPSVILNLTSSEEYSLELKEAVSSALFKYKVRELDSKTRKKILSDLKKKLEMGLLKNKKEEIKKLQILCESEEEMNKFLLNLSEIELSLQNLKNTKKK